MTAFRLDDNKVLKRFSISKNDGTLLKLCIMLLPDNRYAEFIELFMKYFVPEENTYVATGILESPEAMNEFRKHLHTYLKNECIERVICCLDSDETATEIFGGFVLKLYTKDNNRSDDDLKAETEPVKKCKRFDKIFQYLCSPADLLMKYNVDRYYELICAVVRPDMRQIGILKELTESSYLLCQLKGVPLIGAWCTSVGSQKVTENNGSDIMYKISCKELGCIMDIDFDDCTSIIKFMVKIINKRSNL